MSNSIAFLAGMAFGAICGVLFLMLLLWVAIHYGEDEPYYDDEDY